MSGVMIQVRLRTIIVMCCVVLSTCTVSSAELLWCAAEGERPEYKNRFEAGVSADFLNPGGVYGNWAGLHLGFYRKERPDFSWFVLGSGLDRSKEGGGVLGTVGAYKDWTDSIYTYTAVSAGTTASYIPAFRADLDLNFKLGSEKNYVWTLGASYIKYHDVHKDYIFSTGLTAYQGPWVAEYRLFRNISNPGSIGSFAHLIGLGYGKDGCHWTNLSLGFGKQAYQATNLASPEAINRSSVDVTLKHRHWIGKDWGLFGSIGWFNLKNGYEKIGSSFGYFREF